ncbi:hypothetical protein CEXT_723541 [Caerostris extrusa]|uniref:Uncharacterized protein n=1 Tax=Caerostris extrusa TaxID=172846 RepID=A0AAV4QL33_CAEEX|nr:hypothetical protein CEXT_723541 [Caerostris extrusa]
MNTMSFTVLFVTMVTLYSAANAQFNPFDMSRFIPFFPRIPVFTPWYKGPNICVDERNIPNIPEMEGLDDMSGTFKTSGMSESCKGNNYKYVCEKRTTENGQSVRKVVTYQCCPGFVRPADGSSGCTEDGNVTPQ